jgi:hypothetical protein
MMGSENKYHRTEANVYSIECRIGGEAHGYSGLEGRRSEKAQRVTGRGSGSGQIYWEIFRQLRRKKSVEISR